MTKFVRALNLNRLSLTEIKVTFGTVDVTFGTVENFKPYFWITVLVL